MRDGGPGAADFRLRMALSLCFTVGIASAFIMPVIAGSLVAGFGIRADGIGYLISLELGATAVSALAIAPFLPSLKARPTIAAALAVMIAANLACGTITGLGALLALRAAAGLAEGALQAVVIGLAARTAQPHRTFTWIYTTMAALSVGLFVAMPPLQTSLGPRAPFLLIGLAALVVAPAIFALPSRAARADPTAERKQTEVGAGPRLAGFAMLFGWCLFQLGQNGMWSYAGLIAERIHIGFRDLNLVFAASAASTIAATLAAGWCGQRLGLFLPLMLASLVSVFTIFAFPFVGSLTAYAAVTIAFSDALFFATPFAGTLAANAEPSGRLAAMLPAFQSAGMTAGPAVASLALRASQGYFWVGAANAAAALGALLLMAPLAWSTDRGLPRWRAAAAAGVAHRG